MPRFPCLRSTHQCTIRVEILSNTMWRQTATPATTTAVNTNTNTNTAKKGLDAVFIQRSAQPAAPREVAFL